MSNHNNTKYKKVKTKIFLSELIRKPETTQNPRLNKLVVPPLNNATKKKQSDLFLAYFDCISQLINCDDVQGLSKFLQHGSYNRLQHSLNVSYYSYLIAKKLGLDYKSTARGGLLHDLFFYKISEKKFGARAHAFVHPRIALKNANKLFDLNKKEQEIISCHMFPLSPHIPRNIETHIISFVDKICAVHEGIIHACQKSRSVLSLSRKKLFSRS